MPNHPGKNVVEKDFEMLVAAAIKGERCPEDRPRGPIRQGSVTALYEAGRIMSAVYGRGWRVVTILDGPNRGAQTMLPESTARAIRINGQTMKRRK